MDRNMKKWHSYKLSDVVRFNPSERLLKGEIAKKVPMDLLQPYTRGISGFEMASYTGGSKFRNGDTLMARITPCLENGKTAYVSMLDEDEVGFGSTEYIVFRNIEGITDNKFVYYFVTSPWFRDIAVKSMVGSSGRQRVQQAMLENLVVNLPPLAEQKQIAGILGALDDKIELNRCINDKFASERIIIPAGSKESLLEELNFYNINQGALFPELEHQMAYIKYSMCKSNVRSASSFEKIDFDAIKAEESKEGVEIAESVVKEELVDKAIYDIVSQYISDDAIKQNVLRIITRQTEYIDWANKEATISDLRRKIKRSLSLQSISSDVATQSARNMVSQLVNLYVKK